LPVSIADIKRKAGPVLRRYGARRASVFGSVARGEGHARSDIDILVELDDDKSLLDFIGLKLALEDALGQEVDLVEYDAVKPLIRERVMREQVQIL
jgi:predicted nucleotidyltransferase